MILRGCEIMWRASLFLKVKSTHQYLLQYSLFSLFWSWHVFYHFMDMRKPIKWTKNNQMKLSIIIYFYFYIGENLVLSQIHIWCCSNCNCMDMRKPIKWMRNHRMNLLNNFLLATIILCHYFIRYYLLSLSSQKW